MPASRDPGKNIKELAKSHPEMSPQQRVAAGLAMARRAGAHIPSAPKKK